MISGIAGIDTDIETWHQYRYRYLVSKTVSIPKIGIALRYRKIDIPEMGIEIRYLKVSIQGAPKNIAIDHPKLHFLS